MNRMGGKLREKNKGKERYFGKLWKRERGICKEWWKWDENLATDKINVRGVWRKHLKSLPNIETNK